MKPLTAQEKILYAKAKKVNPDLSEQEFYDRREKALRKPVGNALTAVAAFGCVIPGGMSPDDREEFFRANKEDDDK